MTEAQYQAKVVKKLEEIFPRCIVLKVDPTATRRQGFPDLLLLWDDFLWASLEVKLRSKSNRQPNQRYYINRINEMAYAAFICPENEEEVLNALQQAFESPRRARVSQS